MTQYYINNTPVQRRVILKPPPYTCNVLTYQGQVYEIIYDGNDNAWILINGKKRYLEEK
jgi:hypothetical protein